MSGHDEDLVSANARDVLSLRPARRFRVQAMRKNWVFLVLLAICVAAAVLAARSEAHPAPSNPAVCDAIWRAQPPGKRFPAKQRCLAAQLRHDCRHIPRFVPRSVRVKGARAGANQRHVLGWVVSEGVRRGLPRKVVLAAIVATTQESSATELRHGEGTSVGPFQLTDYHGSVAERITVEYSGNWFYNGAMKVHWQAMTPPQIAQAVEKSGYPSAYAQWLPEAKRTLPAIAARCQILLR